MDVTKRLVWKICSVTIPVCALQKSFRVLRIMAISSRAAFPARSPIPLTVHST